MRPNSPYWNITQSFCKELSQWIGDRRVLEIFAGQGELCQFLSNLGVDIHATGITNSKQMHFDVERMEACKAAYTYRDRDVLLMSWPETYIDAALAAMIFCQGRESTTEIIYIGQELDTLNNILGGTATDELFYITTLCHSFSHPSPLQGNIAQARKLHDKDTREQRLGELNTHIKNGRVEQGLLSGHLRGQQKALEQYLMTNKNHC
ncbi:hypothetical protein AB6D11_00060 [Vibrio splendidus]